jgi:hypothetical protein
VNAAAQLPPIVDEATGQRAPRWGDLWDGAWKGRPCFIIGGGPSLRGFDFTRLHGQLTIGLNAAWKMNPTCTLVLDVRLMDVLEETPEWHRYRGTKLWLKSEPHRDHIHFTDIHTLTASRLWTRSMGMGLIRLGHAGPAALNLADVLGASSVYLLGFDMKPTSRNIEHWHDDYLKQKSWNTSAKIFEKYRREMESVADFMDVPVVNLNPDSALTCWPTAHPDTVLPR